MNSWKFILATLVIFGAGVITGALLVTYSDNVGRHPHKESQRKNAASGPPRDNRPPIPQNFLMRTNLLSRLDRELKLNATQREHIEKIINEGQERIRSLCQSIAPELHEELAETREEIGAELTPAQEELFTELLKRRPSSKSATNSPAGTNSPPADKSK